MEILELFGALPYWSYLLLFIVAVGEALPFVGTLVPGHALVVAGGAAASLGYLEPWSVFVIATVGAIVGDALGFWIGQAKGRPALERHGARFGMTKERLDRSEALLKRNPFTAIVGGRFSAFTRAIAPFMAGSLRFPFGRFMVYNVIGGIAWAGSSVVIGYIAGASYQAAEKYAPRVVLALVVAAIAIFVAFRLVRALDRELPHEDAWAFLAGVAGLAAFWVVALDVTRGDDLVHRDEQVAHFVAGYYSPALGKAMALVSSVSGTWTMLAGAALAAAAWVRLRRNWLLRVVAALLLEVAAVWSAKALWHKDRPVPILETFDGYTFPSGHAAASAALAIVLIWFMFRAARPDWQRKLAIAVAIIWPLLVATSRLVLGAHFFTDVLAGLALGAACAGLVLSSPTITRGVLRRGGQLWNWKWRKTPL